MTYAINTWTTFTRGVVLDSIPASRVQETYLDFVLAVHDLIRGKILNAFQLQEPVPEADRERELENEMIKAHDLTSNDG